MTKYILIFVTVFIPVLLWGILFYINNPRKQSAKEIISIFLLGSFSVIPVLLFHEYLMIYLLEYFMETLNIHDSSIVLSVLKLILIFLFIVLFNILFALIQSIVIRIKYKIPCRESFKSLYEKLFSFLPILIFFGIFFVFELISQFAFQMEFLISVLGGIIMFAVLEEYFKYIINPFLIYKKINSVGAALVNSLYIGLAFAFVENIYFVTTIWGEPDFWVTFGFRSVFTTLLHVSASGIIGYFYGLCTFSKSIVTKFEIEKSEYKSFSKIRKVLGLEKKSIFTSISIVQGFFLASILHMLYNLLLFYGLKYVAAIIVIIFSFGIIYILGHKNTHIQYGLIGKPEMPKKDFEELYLKISVLQHLKEIREGNIHNEKNPI